jgi:hypothetical protein
MNRLFEKLHAASGWWPPVLCLFVLLVLFYFPVVFGGRTLTTSGVTPGVLPSGPYGCELHPTFSVVDPGQSAWMDDPYAYLAGKELKQGKIPLWNPYNGLGIPLVGDILTSVFYPLKLFVYILPNPIGWDVFFLLRILLAGICIYGFVRSLGCSSPAALTAAAGFMFCGPLTRWVNAFHLSVDILIPLQFWLAEILAKRREKKFYFLNAAVLALSILGGNPQPTILATVSVFFYYVLRRAHIATSERASVVRSLAWSLFDFGIVILVGVGLSAFQVLPFVEYFRLGTTTHSGTGLVSMPLKYIEGFLFPLKYKTTIPLASVGIGCLIMSLAFAGCLDRKKFFPRNIFIAALWLLWILKFLGFAGVSWIGRLPVFWFLNFVKYSPALIAFLACVLAGMGLDCARENRASRRIVISLVAMLMFLLFIGFLARHTLLTTKGYWFIALAGATASLFLLYKDSSSRWRKSALAAMPFLVFLEMAAASNSNLPKRYYPYTKPPYAGYLEKFSRGERVFSLDGVLYLNVSSALRAPNLAILATAYENRYFSFLENIDPVFATRFGESFRLAGQRTEAVYSDSRENRLLNLVGIKYFLANYPLNTGSFRERITRTGFTDKGVPLNHARTWGSPGGDNAYPEIFFQYPPSKIYLPLKVPENAESLEFSFGMDPLVWSPQYGDGAGFTVSIDAGGGEKAVFNKYIDPKNKPEDRHWHVGAADVKSLRGRSIKLGLATDAGPKNNVHCDWAFWLSLEFHPSDTAPRTNVYEKVYESEIIIYKNPNALPRAFLAGDVRIANNPDEILPALMDAATNLSSTAFIERPPGANKSASDAGKTGVAEIVEYQPDKVSVNVRAEKPCLLVLSDLYYPGWNVRVNGQKQPILRTDYLLRGVSVPKGESSVEFSYKPVSFQLGLSLTFLTIGILFSILFFCSNKRKISFLILALAATMLAVASIEKCSGLQIRQLAEIIYAGKVPPILE